MGVTWYSEFLNDGCGRRNFVCPRTVLDSTFCSLFLEVGVPRQEINTELHRMITRIKRTAADLKCNILTASEDHYRSIPVERSERTTLQVDALATVTGPFGAIPSLSFSFNVCTLFTSPPLHFSRRSYSQFTGALGHMQSASTFKRVVATYSHRHN